VEKILFQKGSEIIASGVQFVSRTSKRFIVKATREVVLSAGAINPPQILELSGIGSSEILTRHGIDVVVENPNVGEHLQDHPLVLLSFEVADGVCKFHSNLVQDLPVILRRLVR
jgi:choline dehydrogenase-like flavoprotein